MPGVFVRIVFVRIVGVCQQFFGWRDAIFVLRPGQLLLARKAAAMFPALIGTCAAAAVVLARKRLRKVLDHRHR